MGLVGVAAYLVIVGPCLKTVWKTLCISSHYHRRRLGFQGLAAEQNVPVAEERAFRGYVMHKLVAQNFETVRPGPFTW